ncbi:4-hydroxy-tetrahydrodipicolinate reductase [Tistrella sp. BH-R2-4]|jgi:4-hydroxy-tetrahydrodipicolinate reductase|uniref:4-hydroxy-tetrahydrodipicolinate reductase n=1 Tax=Tistrella arctica TaxID=3133430 RepID=A0ABU9YH52_9PROT
MSGIAIGVVGCAGRMGRMLLATIAATDGCRIAGGTEARGNEAVGQDLGRFAGTDPLGIPVGDDPAALFDAADVVIDFTRPKATVAHARLAAARGKALVTGTTGLDAGDEAMLRETARGVPMVYAPNMSLGVTLLMHLVEQAAARLGPDYDIEIVEMHHRHKIDAPSGTALGLARAAARGRDVSLDDVADRGRDGDTGPRRRGAIGMAALRGGDVVGDHQVIFAADGERLELGHRASSRETFARGAVAAAIWVAGRTPGLYDMRDVLDLR